jgi:hypothetical protein
MADRIRERMFVSVEPPCRFAWLFQGTINDSEITTCLFGAG